MVVISTKKSKLQLDVIHGFLTETYWAKCRTLEAIKTRKIIACALAYM